MTAEVDGLMSAEKMREKGRWFGRKGMEKTAQDFFAAADALSRLQRELQEQQRLVEGLRKDVERFANQHAQVLEAVREMGLHSHWNAPHWTLHVKREYADKLFNVVYGFDQQILKDTAFAVHAIAAIKEKQE